MPRGGARPGAGRKPDPKPQVFHLVPAGEPDPLDDKPAKPPAVFVAPPAKHELAMAASKPPELIPVQEHFDDPEDFFRAVMNSAATEGTLRLNAAKALAALKKTAAPPKPPPLGKKAQRDLAARAAAASLAGEHDDIA